MLVLERLRTSAAARLLGCSEQSVRAWAASGRLQAIETPLGKLYDRADVEALAAERERQRAQRVRVRQVRQVRT